MANIKDSGCRRTFDSGSVRDMSTPENPKGRCDLMPLEVASNILLESEILANFRRFQIDESTTYLYAALIDFCEEAYHGCEETMLLEVAKHFEAGMKKYGPDNWRKSIPTWSYIDSATRHYLKWRRGDKDEAHDKSFVWNVMCCIWEVDYHDYETSKN